MAYDFVDVVLLVGGSAVVVGSALRIESALMDIPFSKSMSARPAVESELGEEKTAHLVTRRLQR